MKIILLALTICYLTSCSTLPENPKPPQVTVVKVPVQVKCLGDIPVRPAFLTDQQLYALPPGEFVTALHIDRFKRDIYAIELETAIEGCK